MFDTGGPIGSDHLMIVTPTDADAEWNINRWFYFNEQVERYMWNFAEKVCTDSAYRRRSQEGDTDWARVATQYEPRARQLYDALSESAQSEFPIMTDDSREDSALLTSLCKELFEEVRAFVRQESTEHPDDIYLEKRRSLQEWLETQ